MDVLILSPLMQRQALILDRDKAARMCRTQEVHRIEAQLRALTTRMLAKGSCSE